MNIPKVKGSWTVFREIEGKRLNIDFHKGSEDLPDDFEVLKYFEKTSVFMQVTLDAIRKGYELDFEWVLFTHGNSTSRPGATTARSCVRGVVRSSEATPYILRSKSFQHDSAMMIKIRKKLLLA